MDFEMFWATRLFDLWGRGSEVSRVQGVAKSQA